MDSLETDFSAFSEAELSREIVEKFYLIKKICYRANIVNSILKKLLMVSVALNIYLYFYF